MKGIQKVEKIKRAFALLINHIDIWIDRGIDVVEWHQDCETIHLTMRRCGLFKKYAGNPVHCDIELGARLVVWDDKEPDNIPVERVDLPHGCYVYVLWWKRGDVITLQIQHYIRFFNSMGIRCIHEINADLTVSD